MKDKEEEWERGKKKREKNEMVGEKEMQGDK